MPTVSPNAQFVLEIEDTLQVQTTCMTTFVIKDYTTFEDAHDQARARGFRS